MTWQVRTPVQGYTGEVCGIPFVQGEALVPDSAIEALQYFRRKGYGLKELAAPGTPAESAVESDADAGGGAGPRPTSKSSKDEWAAYAAAALDIPLEDAAAKSLKDLKALLETHEQENSR